MLYQVYQGWWKLLDLLFPPHCPGCGNAGERFCRNCLQSVKPIQYPVCQICGDSVTAQAWELCDRCRLESPSFSAVRSWAAYEDPLRKAVLHLKYSPDAGLGMVMAEKLAGLLEIQSWDVDLVTVVPLDHRRFKKRGYNQSELLAKPLAICSHLEYSAAAVFRTKPTRSQVGLAYQERLTNVQGAFSAVSGKVAGKSILIIDDVVTTGATINSCAAALREAGARDVFGLTLARAS